MTKKDLVVSFATCKVIKLLFQLEITKIFYRCCLKNNVRKIKIANYVTSFGMGRDLNVTYLWHYERCKNSHISCDVKWSQRLLDLAIFKTTKSIQIKIWLILYQMYIFLFYKLENVFFVFVIFGTRFVQRKLKKILYIHEKMAVRSL